MRLETGFIAFAALLAASSALAQASATRNTTVPAGKSVRIGVVTALRKDCSVGPVGTITVLTPPKLGQFSIKGGRAKTPASFRCPNVETPIQELLYETRPGASGSDEITYEAKNAEGGTEMFTIKITISDKPSRPGPRGGVTDL